MKPMKSTMTVLKQVVELIPSYLVSKLASKHGVDKQSHTFKPRNSSALSTVVTPETCHVKA